MRQAQLSTVDVHIAEFGWSALSPARCFYIARWQAGTRRGVAGFNLFAGKERLNPRLIPVTGNGTYVYRTRWAGPGKFVLRIVLENGVSMSYAP